MTLIQEFRKFIARGNVLDLAVAVLIGAAFGKIITALTENILMPLIGWVFGDIDFSNHFVLLGEVPAGYAGSLSNYTQLKAAGVPMIGYGEFLTQFVNFLIVAAALFLLVRTINRLSDSMAEELKDTTDTSESPAVPADPQLDVLREIRDAIRKQDQGT